MSGFIDDIEISASGSFFAAEDGGGIYKSATGAAASWSLLGGGLPSAAGRIEMACAPSNGNRIYAMFESGNVCGGIYRSSDGGTSWTSLTVPGAMGMSEFTRGQAWYDFIMGVNPTDANQIWIGGVDVLRSTDAGATWTQMTQWYGGGGFPYIHADQHGMFFLNGNTAYFTNDGGIFQTANASATNPAFSVKGDGYNVTQFYACAIHPTAGQDEFLAGAQDNGSQRFLSAAISNTTEVTGGDGAYCHIDQDQPNIQITAYVYNDYFITNNSWGSNTEIGSGGSGSFINPTDYDDAGNNLYGCHNTGAYEITQNVGTSNTMSTRSIAAFAGARITSIRVSPNTANRVFFGLNNGDVVRVDNANAASPTGTVIRAGSGSVSCVEVEQGNDNHLLVTYSNYGQVSVYESINGGTAWTAAEGNLPDMPIRWALFNPNNAAQALLATEIGVWSTDLINGSTTVWGPSNTGMGNVCTYMLQYRTSDKMVIAATHGRGLFSSDVFTTPTADFDATPRVTYTTRPVQFINSSLQDVSWAWNFGDGNTSTLENPSHTYNVPGRYTVTLTINGGASSKTETQFIHVLPDRNTPYLVGDGGNFDVNPDDFDAIAVSGVNFERGNSAIAGKNSTFSGAFAWVTGLTDATYTDNAETALYTPAYDFSVSTTYTLRFRAKYNVENTYDGFRVEYTTDKGLSWHPVGTTTAASWYNYANPNNDRPFPQNEAFFTNSSSSFTQYTRDVSALSPNTNVAFRIVFKSDGGVTAPGVAIEDFEILRPIALSVSGFELKAKWLDSGEAQLDWKTRTEVNCQKFKVERSLDKQNFSIIGEVNANGNSNLTQNYDFMDSPTGTSKVYYRITAIDINGAEASSNMVELQRPNSFTQRFSAYPNPFESQVNVRLSFPTYEPVLIRLTNLNGQVLAKWQTTGEFQEMSCDMPELSQGVYLLEVSINGELLDKQRIVKK